MKEVKQSALIEKLEEMGKGSTKLGVWELRKLYGMHISKHNMFMPLGHWFPIAFAIQANLTTYKGIECSKLPTDAWVMQEIIFRHKPTLIIEIGNLAGGSAVMLMDWLECIPNNKGIIAVDIDHSHLDPRAKERAGITWIEGDANSDETIKRVASLITPEDRVMAIDDSSHMEEKTYQILKNYSPFVSKGQYFIVEDTILGRIVPRSHREFGADIGVERFMKETNEFDVITYWQKWFITTAPGGFLQKRDPDNPNRYHSTWTGYSMEVG